MRLLLEPTATPAIIDGTLCRLWTGTDEDGIPVHAWILHITPQTHDADALRAFGERLQEVPTPVPIGLVYQTPPVTAPPPYHPIDPNYDNPDQQGLT